MQAQRQNLAALQQQYLASRRPLAEPTADERAARPWDKMTGEDGLDLARTSKYGANISADDPLVRQGFAEVTTEAWRSFVRWVRLVESIFTDEGETPPAHIRPIAIAEFCKRYRVERHRVDAALEAWGEDPGTVH